MANQTGSTNNGSKSNDLANNENHCNPKTFVIVNCALNAPLILVTILGDALVLGAIIRTPSIRSPSMIMLCSLACSDLLVGFVAQPLFIADELIKEDHILHHVSAMIGFAVCGISLATITAVSVDRFFALHYHMTYAALVTDSRVIYTIIVIWLFNFAYSGLHLWDKVVFHLMSAIFTGVCLAISTLCYIRIYQVAQRHRLQIQVQEQAAQSRVVENQTNRMRLKRSAINTFIFLYFPDCVLYSLVYFTISLWNFLRRLENGMDHLDYHCFYEFVHESNFILLAYSRASSGSFKGGSKDVVYSNRSSLKHVKTGTFIVYLYN